MDDHLETSASGAAGSAEAVKDSELRRLRALVDVDMEAAGALHAPDFRVVDPRGGTHGRDEYLEGLAAGLFDYRRFEPVSDIEVMTSGDLAVVHYRSRIDVMVHGRAPQSLEAWNTNCYRRAPDADAWQAVLAQETAVGTD